MPDLARDIRRQLLKGEMLNPEGHLRRYGMMFTVKAGLSRQGIRTYSTVRYPDTDIDVVVRPQRYWRELEMGNWESSCISHVRKVAKKGDLLLDIGAFHGAYSLLFSKLAGEGGKIYAFEPDPDARAVLIDNLRKNRATNVHVLPSCVADAPGTAILKSLDWGLSGATIMGHLNGGVAKRITVEATSVDAFCAANGVRPSGMKIDVEGAEGLVLQGARRVIRDFSPWVLLEFHSLFMSEEMKEANWKLATESAKRITFVNGKDRTYSPGDEMDELPKSDTFHVLIDY